MQNLDYTVLQPLSANTNTNKSCKAKDNPNCVNELEKYINNFKSFMLNQNVYDMTSLLITEQDWLNRHSKQPTFSDNLVGKILKVDFGKSYVFENGFIHYAICLAEYQGKYCVVPATTSNDEIKKAFHPQFRPDGEKRLYLLKKSDGNNKDSALFINDIKFISSGRIIDVGKKISDTAYNNIINLACEIMFHDIHNKMHILENENATLKEKVKLLELICENSQKKI